MLGPGSGRPRCKVRGVQGETRICVGPAENEDSRIGTILYAVPETPSGTEGGSGVCKTSVVGTRVVNTD